MLYRITYNFLQILHVDFKGKEITFYSRLKFIDYFLFYSSLPHINYKTIIL